MQYNIWKKEKSFEKVFVTREFLLVFADHGIEDLKTGF